MSIFLACVSVHHLTCLVLPEARRGCHIPRDWSYRCLQATRWVLGNVLVTVLLLWGDTMIKLTHSEKHSIRDWLVVSEG